MRGACALLLAQLTTAYLRPSVGVGRLERLRSSPLELQRDIADLLAPFGSPALNVPEAVANAVDAKCASLEGSAPPAPLALLQGRWRVAYATAPSPSNGALGPFRGAAVQIVDVDKKTYVNELTVGPLRVRLAASYEARSDAELRVTFESIEAALFGNVAFSKKFPPNVERTWCLTYTDAAVRVVRAGVDGGRSLSREAGFVSGGDAKDSYLFYLTKERA